MTTGFRVSTTLARKLEELGVSPADVLRHAGLPNGLFEQEKILVSTEELFALYRAVGESSRDPRRAMPTLPKEASYPACAYCTGPAGVPACGNPGQSCVRASVIQA